MMVGDMFVCKACHVSRSCARNDHDPAPEQLCGLCGKNGVCFRCEPVGSERLERPSAFQMLMRGSYTRVAPIRYPRR
jgi:hypothetical protein